MEIVQLDEITVSGISTHLSMKNRAQSGRAIHSLWKKFYKKFPHAFENPSYGVYTNYSGFSGINTSEADCDLHVGGEQISGETVMVIPAGRYVKHRVVGQMPNAVLDGWRAVAYFLERPGSPLPTHLCNFEKYLSEVDAEIYLSVE